MDERFLIGLLVALAWLALGIAGSFTMRKWIFQMTWLFPARWRLNLLWWISLRNPRDRSNVLRHTLGHTEALVEFLRAATRSDRGVLDVLGDGNSTGLVVITLLEALGSREATMHLLQRALGTLEAAQRMYESAASCPDYNEFVHRLGALAIVPASR